MVQMWVSMLYTQQSGSDFGDMAQGTEYLTLVIDRTIGAFGQLTGVVQDVSKLAAGAERVSRLVTVLQGIGDEKQDGGGRVRAADGLSLDAVDLNTPAGVLLAGDLKFSVPAGKSLMV